MKIVIGNQSNNDEQLSKALIQARDGDIIELLPGSYFSPDSPFICTIRRNITLIGTSKNKNDVKLYCSFTVGEATTIILKNLTINYMATDENTLAAYDGARVYGNNITIDRKSEDDWDTVYGQNSFFSFKDSNIYTGAKTKAIGLSLENSQIFAIDSFIELMFQKNSKSFLKDSTITNKLELRRHSELNFNNLTIDSTKFHVKNDLAVKSNSQFSGQNLIFIRPLPQIRILKSKFNVTGFQPELNYIDFESDKSSEIFTDGFNQGPSDSSKNTK